MQEDGAVGRSRAWRLAGVLLLLVACAAAGWFIGHATAGAATVVQQIAVIADGIGHPHAHAIAANLGN